MFVKDLMMNFWTLDSSNITHLLLYRGGVVATDGFLDKFFPSIAEQAKNGTKVGITPKSYVLYLIISSDNIQYSCLHVVSSRMTWY